MPQVKISFLIQGTQRGPILRIKNCTLSLDLCSSCPAPSMTPAHWDPHSLLCMPGFGQTAQLYCGVLHTNALWPSLFRKIPAFYSNLCDIHMTLFKLISMDFRISLPVLRIAIRIFLPEADISCILEKFTGISQISSENSKRSLVTIDKHRPISNHKLENTIWFREIETDEANDSILLCLDKEDLFMPGFQSKQQRSICEGILRNFMKQNPSFEKL